jgi:transposase
MVFGSRAGCEAAALRLTSSIPRALRCRANIDAQRRIALIRSCCYAPCSAGCGEKRHCSMVAIPTIEQEDAKRPNRERDNLVAEQTSIVNQIKAILICFGIRSFRPKLRKTEEQLRNLRTAGGSPLPENTRAELCRHLGRLRMVREQVRAVEKERLQKLNAERGQKKGPHAMVRLLARVVGIGVETADMLVNEVFSRQFRDRRAGTRRTMIIALARKLLIALWRLVTTGEMSDGIVLRPAS